MATTPWPMSASSWRLWRKVDDMKSWGSWFRHRVTMRKLRRRHNRLREAWADSFGAEFFALGPDKNPLDIGRGLS